jgi:hypothetical protein
VVGGSIARTRSIVSAQQGLAQAGISELAVTLYELGDFKHLAEKHIPAHVSPSDLAVVHGVGRRQGEWRLQVRCPRCGAWHVFGAGVGIEPHFGVRTPPCGHARYWLTLA